MMLLCHNFDSASCNQERRYPKGDNWKAIDPQRHVAKAPPYLLTELLQIGVRLSIQRYPPDGARHRAEWIPASSHMEWNALDRRESLQIGDLFCAHAEIQRDTFPQPKWQPMQVPQYSERWVVNTRQFSVLDRLQHSVFQSMPPLPASGKGWGEVLG